MRGVGALGGKVQCKLLPEPCVSMLLAALVSLRSRLTSRAADLCWRRRHARQIITNPRTSSYALQLCPFQGSLMLTFENNVTLSKGNYVSMIQGKF